MAKFDIHPGEAIMLVETTLTAMKMERDGEIETNESEDLESFALTMLYIAEKSQEAFDGTEEKPGGWDEAYEVMEKLLLEEYPKTDKEDLQEVDTQVDKEG